MKADRPDNVCRQALEASGYLAIFIAPGLLLLGVWIDQPSLAFGTVMLVFPLLRGVFGGTRPRGFRWNETIATSLDRLPVVHALVFVAAVAAVLEHVHAGAIDRGSKAVGLGLSLWVAMLLATCVAHELIHRRSRFDALVGHCLAGIAGYPFLGREHLIHHGRAGETRSPQWPRVNETVWKFTSRRVPFVLRDAAHAVGASRLWFSATLATGLAFGIAGGANGLAAYMVAAAGVGLFMQILTYVQHWGLGDDHVDGADRVHYAWEDDCRFQAWVTLNISLHQAHHRASRLPYYRLVLADDSPRLPSGYVVMMLICLVPNWWRKLMRPALEHWKARPANPRSPGRSLTCFAAYGVTVSSAINQRTSE